MIIPVAFEVKEKSIFEDFLLGGLADGIALPDPPKDMRVTVKLYDTDTRRGLGFSAKVLVDPKAEPYHELMTVFKIDGDIGTANRNYLQRLRAEIDRVLEGEN
jgi:hypothetical protein